MIEFDVETQGLQYYDKDQRAFMYAFFDGQESEVIHIDEPNARPRIQKWFDRAKIEGIRAWNSKFDWHFAEAAGFDVPAEELWHDGMVAAHILDERRSVALKAVAAELFGEDERNLEKDVKKWLADERRRRAKEAKENKTDLIEPNYSDVPDDLMRPYAEQDVILTRKVAGVYDPLIEANAELQELYEFEMNVMGALYDVEKIGFPVDEEAFKLLELDLYNRLDWLEDEAVDLAGDPEFNPRSSPQIYAALKRRGADLTFVTGESMDADNLKTVNDDLARVILDYRAEMKAYSTYVNPMVTRSWDSGMRTWKAPFIAPDGRIHPNFRQIGARTGRMSCSDPNLQNIPRDDLRLRYCFMAPPGYKLVCCDLSNIEMRVLAAYAGDGELMQAIKQGKDLHMLTANNLGIRERRRGEGVIESARQRGKTFNFSVVYGAGVNKIRKEFQVPQAEARLMFRRYHDSYPEVGRLQNRIQWKLQDQGYIKSLWGRRYRCYDANKEGYKFMNYLIQGTSADLFKDALVKIHKDGIPVVAVVHDEIVACVPEAEAKEAEAIIKKHLVEHPRLTEKSKLPLEADGAIVDRWSDAKKPGYVPDFMKGS